MAMVLLAVLGWWLFSGNGPQGPAGNDARYAVPEVEATGSPGDGPASADATPGALRIDSYVVTDELRVALNFRADPGCTGALESPRVLETDAAVTVTLTTEPPDGGDAACTGRLERRTETVLLDTPLDGRAILDGSVSPQVRVEQTASTYR